MAKTSKFSFPLPGRKGRPQRDQDASNVADEPKLSKAERLLGASNLPVNNQPQGRPELHKQPSSLTLTVYESSIDDYDELSDLEYPVPDLPRSEQHDPLESPQPDAAPRYGPFPRSLSLNQKTSPRIPSERKGHPRSMSSNAIPSVRHFKSSAALNSEQYQAIPSIPERPSAQDIREMNSSRSLHHNASVSRSVRAPIMEGDGEGGVNRSPSILQERRKPSRLDLTKLFPKSGGVNGNPSSNRVASSPTSLFSSGEYRPEVPVFPPQLPSLSSGGMKTQRKLSKSRRGAPMEERRPQTASGSTIRAQRRENSRRTKHWFDGLLEAEDQFEVSFEPEEILPPLPTRVHSPVKSRNLSREEISIRLVDRSSPVRSSPMNMVPVYETPMKRTSWQGHYAQSMRASVISDQTQQGGYSPQYGISNVHSRFSRDTSFTEQASFTEQTTPIATEFPSVEESEFEDDCDSHFAGVRDSIAIDELDETVTIGEAQAFQVGPRRVIGDMHVTSNIQPDSLLNDRPHFAQIQSPRAIVIPVTPRLTEDTQDKAPEAENATNCNVTTIAPSRPDSMISVSPRTTSPRPDSKHKLMAVTAEEEALLAMMRQKRAAMASHSFAAGYKTALMSSPQSPMFVNVRNGGEGGTTLDPRSRSSRGDLTQTIDPPLSPPPAGVLPAPPEEPMDGPESPAVAQETIVQSLPEHPPTTLSSPAPIDTLYNKLSALPNSPTLNSFGLSMSPSNTSQLSGLPSPVTPHALRSTNDVAVVIAPGSSRSNSTASDTDILECAALESQKMFPSPPSSTESRRRTDGSSAIGSDDDRSSFEVQPVSSEVTPKAKEILSPHQIPLQLSPIPYQRSVYAEDNHHDNNTTDFLHQKQTQHVHHNGCCDENDIRCSVADDVLAAWGDLGGWQDLERFRMCA